MNSKFVKTTFSLLNVDYVRLNKSWNYKNILSPFYRLYLIDEGHGSLGNRSEFIVLESGYLYLVPSFTLCNYDCSGSLGQYYIQFIEESWSGSSLFLHNRKVFKVKACEIDFENFRQLLLLNPNRGLVKNDPADYEKSVVLHGFQELNNLVPLAAYIETKGIILQLVSRFLNSDEFWFGEKSNFPPRIQQAVDYIDSHFHLNITVEALAERASQSPDYFSRLFNVHTGERPLSYVQFKRIEHAQFLMIQSDLSLNEIALKTGFESLSYFSRIFKQRTGQTPSEYKKKNKIV
jgi:AraC family transcriptional regulator